MDTGQSEIPSSSHYPGSTTFNTTNTNSNRDSHIHYPEYSYRQQPQRPSHVYSPPSHLPFPQHSQPPVIPTLPSIRIPVNPYAAQQVPSHSHSNSHQSHPSSPYGTYPSSPYTTTPGYPYTSTYPGVEDRSLRSPHPPLTAGLYPNYQQSLSHPHPGQWPPPFPSSSKDQTQHQHYSDLPSVPQPSPYRRNSYVNVNHPIPHAQSSPGVYDQSPIPIPPPLRFNYSHSPPSNSDLTSNMPPRKKPTATNPTSSTPQTVLSSSTSSRRRPGTASTIATNAKGNGWTMEHTYDSVGQKKEVIVIDDSASPLNGVGKLPRKRTRAVAAQEAAALSGTENGTRSVASTGAKKRKVDEGSDAGSIKRAKAKVSTAASGHTAHVPAIVQKQLAAASVAAANGTGTPWDDAEGHYIVKPDDVIGGKYVIIRLLGQGTFGKVVEARNIDTRKRVAIKVIRAIAKYRDASKIEIRVLETLKKNDPNNFNKCIHLEEYFDFRNHPCLVSELYGQSVFDFLKQNSFQHFPEQHIQDFAKSLLKSLSFLHKNKLVHTDLKPENILLVANDYRLQGARNKTSKAKHILKNTDIRLIDFGSATFENEYHSSVVSTRHYRAPEIILGMTWSYPCDLFSIGCILVEFFTGDALFQTHDNLEHLAMMEVVMGQMPDRMVQRGKVKKPEFFKGNRVDYPNPGVSRSSRKYVKGLKKLSDIIPPVNPHNKHFLDLIVRLLDFDPDTRMTVSSALRHPYLQLDIPPPP